MEIPGYFRYIRIKGLPGDPLEMVQGIGGDRGSSESPVHVSIEDDAGSTGSIDAALWSAQSAYIEGEISYLKQLNKQWKETQELLEGGKLETIFEMLGEVIEEGISIGLFALLAKAGIVLTGGTALIIGVMVSFAVHYGWSKLKNAFVDWLKEGNKLLEAMMAENDALLTVTQSLENYNIRNEVIVRHERTILRLLEELEAIKTNTEKLTTKNGTIEELFKKAFLVPKTENGEIVKDENGNIVYEGFFDHRLEDLAYNDKSFRVGDVEISTRGRYVKH